jgi:hypothetical protein
VNKKRPHTASDRCEDCALHRSKAQRFNASSIDDDMFLDFRESIRTGTPFWCHGPNERQVCRGWLAIMERRWASAEWDINHPWNDPRTEE